MKKQQLLGIGMSLLMLVGNVTSVYAGTWTMRNVTPAQIASEMNVGWNLGNSLDAYGTYSLDDETCWKNPRTTKRMIDTVKAQGFNTIRIPVSWGDHIVGEGYKIDDAWMNRVQEVVDYAIDDNTYVLLDTHHESHTWLKPESASVAAAHSELAAIWSQIAYRFRDYGDHLLFEGMNEPRIIGSSHEWNGGDADGRAAINALNNTFISAVRKTGGNNRNRCLIICPYGNNGEPNGLSGFELPNDPNIMVAIHAYTPYGFTYIPEGNPSWSTSVWDGTQKYTIEDVMSRLNDEIVSKGVPVIITEFGAVNKNNEADVIRWTKDYMETAAKYGIKCIWWDNNQHGAYDGESFGLLDRSTCTWTRKGVADMLVRCGNNSQGSNVGGTAAPKVSVKMTEEWGNVGVGNITITNTTGRPLNGWSFTFTSNRPISQMWDVEGYVQTGYNTYTITSPSGNSYLAPGASHTFGCVFGQGSPYVEITNARFN